MTLLPTHVGVITGSLGGRWHRRGWVARAAFAPKRFFPQPSQQSWKVFLSFAKSTEAKEGSGWRGLDAGLWVPWEPERTLTSQFLREDRLHRAVAFYPVANTVWLWGRRVPTEFLVSPLPPSLYPKEKAQRIGSFYFPNYYCIFPPSSPIHFVRAVSICVNTHDWSSS